jgi:hypothetical protein
MPSALRLRAWISMAGRALCITRPNRINSTFRLSCADKRINHWHSSIRSAVPWRASAWARTADLTLCYSKDFWTLLAIFAAKLQGPFWFAPLPEKSIRGDFGQGPDRSAAGKR